MENLLTKTSKRLQDIRAFRFRNLLFIALATTILAGCCESESITHYIDPVYIPDYEKGDTLLFESTEGEIDSFIIDKIWNGFDEDCDEAVCETCEYAEHFYIRMEPIDEDLFSELNEVAIYDKSKITVHWFTYHAAVPVEIDTTFENIVIDEQLIKSFVLYDRNNELLPSIMNYNHKYGILKYIKDKKEWTLKKLPK